MAFAVSAERTVLWDQIQYRGAPEDFSWVLPVRPGAFIETSTDAWFETLESVTQTRVTAPQLRCANATSAGCGCGSASADSGSAKGTSFDDGGNQVTVLHQGAIGPYETVTLRSTDGDALTSWLESNGYFVPPDIAPTIAAYVSEGSDFIALRLRPGAGVQQMTPVRVVTPGGEGLLPLRMVAAGIGDSVDIVLYGIAEQRLSMPDLHEVTVDSDALVWDFAKSSANYADVRKQALARNLGFSVLTSFAERGAFSKQHLTPDGLTISYQADGRVFNNFADLYLAQAAANDPTVPRTCPSFTSKLESDQLVAQVADASALSASSFACGPLTDIAAAVTGMHPARIWLTRFELDLPREALTMDCVVTPNPSQESVSNALLATHYENRPASCQELVFESRLASGSPSRPGVWLSVLGVTLLARWRRRVRKSGR